MNKNLKHTRAMAYLRQLCCSGLDKAIVMPEFLRAVAQVIPSSNNCFVLCDDHFPASIMFGYLPAEVASNICELTASYWTVHRLNLMMSLLQAQGVVQDMRQVDPHFYRSDIYHNCFLPLEQHNGMVTTVCQHGVPVGFFSLYRPKMAKIFINEEIAMMLRLMPYVAHAATAAAKQDLEYCENGMTGMMIMDSQGKLCFQSRVAQELLNLASHPFITPVLPQHKAALLTKLAQLCRNLDTIYRGGDAAPPSWCHINGRGRFIFRAQWLDSQAHETGGLIGMTIEHQEPLLLKILRALQDTPLSPIQKEVAALLAQGASNEKICQTLHIKLTTAKDHIKKIYTRLDIERREQLLPILLAKEKEQLIQLH
jgi:DNA-binding CsgD family transcriptional regulator